MRGREQVGDTAAARAAAAGGFGIAWGGDGFQDGEVF